MSEHRRRPLPDDCRLAGPGKASGPLKRLYRTIIRRLLGWWIDPVVRSTEDLVYREALLRHSSYQELNDRLSALENMGIGPRLGRLESTRPNDPAGPSVPPDAHPGLCGTTACFDSFAFSAAFRGDDASLTERAVFYLSLFSECPDPLLDLGCGRGAFLKACSDAGRTARGVDVSRSSVRHCRSFGLDVEQTSACEALESINPGSLGGVLASHLFEHLDLPRIVRLLDLINSRLSAAGRLVAEMPNTKTLSGLSGFYIDPSHTTPLPPETFRFLLERSGFELLDIHFADSIPDEARLVEIPRAVERENSDCNERISRNFALIDERLFGPMTYCCVACPRG